MPAIKQITIYKFSELEPAAKEAARNWAREGFNHDRWWDAVFDDFMTIGEMLGVTFDERQVRLMNGKYRGEPKIWFSGFSSQGDGASFEGRYSYAKGAAKAIRAYTDDAELHQIVDTLQEVQRRNMYQLNATVSQSGHYSHAYTMSVDVERDSSNYQQPTADAEETILGTMRDLANWLYRHLNAEYDYLTGDEAIDEMLEANDYDFNADGSVA